MSRPARRAFLLVGAALPIPALTATTAAAATTTGTAPSGPTRNAAGAGG
ncbi:hypothetical protein [Kitasatospora purpeofusca]